MEPEPQPTQDTLPPPESGLQAGCCWIEREPGRKLERRCGAPVLPGRPFCGLHWYRHEAGKCLRGRRPRYGRHGTPGYDPSIERV
jgi:hypothetical protein